MTATCKMALSRNAGLLVLVHHLGVVSTSTPVPAAAEVPPVYGCIEPDAFNYNPDATANDGSCENPCDNHNDLEDGYTWYYNRGAFATICTPTTRIDDGDYVMNQLSLHASSKHSDGEFDGMWSANDWEFIAGQVESGFKTSILGMFWVKIYLDDYGDMHTIDGKKKTKSCDDYDSDDERYKTTVLLLGGEGFGFGNTDKKDGQYYCGASDIFTACDKYLNDGDDSTGEIQCADTPYSGFFFAPVPGGGSTPKWEDLGEDDDPSLPVSQITLRTDASGEFQFIYGYRESYANTEPKVEINGIITDGRMIIETIVDRTNGRNTELFAKPTPIPTTPETTTEPAPEPTSGPTPGPTPKPTPKPTSWPTSGSSRAQRVPESTTVAPVPSLAPTLASASEQDANAPFAVASLSGAAVASVCVVLALGVVGVCVLCRRKKTPKPYEDPFPPDPYYVTPAA